jgi:hypothetical protein
MHLVRQAPREAQDEQQDKEAGRHDFACGPCRDLCARGHNICHLPAGGIQRLGASGVLRAFGHALGLASNVADFVDGAKAKRIGRGEPFFTFRC